MHFSRPARVAVLGAALATVAAVAPIAATAAHADTPAPVVTSITPVDGPAAGGTTVTIDGSNFTGATVVDFGATAATNVVVVSDTEMTATSPAGTSGMVDITVVTPGGTSATGSDDEFTYGGPTITSLSPSSGYTSGGTKVTITGSGFDPQIENDDVEFGDEGSADIVSATTTSIVAYSPSSLDTGSQDVTVQVEGDTGPTSNTEPFTYLPAVSILAVEGGNKALYVSSDGGKYVNYGGLLKGTPSVVSTNDRNYYFVRGTDDNLYVRDDKSTYTKLRPSAALDCATAPAATSYGDGRFIVGCVGTNGRLYTAAGALPATGNPTITSLFAAPGTYGSDLTPTKGAVGSDPFGDLLAIGAGYGASGAVSSGEEAYAKGNTYVIDVDDVTGQVESGDFGVQRLGGSCAGAPQVGFAESDGFDVICRNPASAATLVYRNDFTESGNTETVATTVTNLGGAALGSPAAITDQDAEVLVLVTGTNGRLYGSLVDDESATAFGPSQIAGTSVTGPGVNAGPPPAATSRARREFAARHSFVARHARL